MIVMCMRSITFWARPSCALMKARCAEFPRLVAVRSLGTSGTCDERQKKIEELKGKKDMGKPIGGSPELQKKFNELKGKVGAGENAAGSKRLRCIMLNAARLDYDGRIDFKNLQSVVADVRRYESSHPSEVIDRLENAEVVINKEMPLTAEMIRAFPPTVKLICEAGTGYNNIDLDACRQKGINVCNIPTYATEAMAHMAITLVMALSCSLVPQARALQAGDRTHMLACHLGKLPHFELTGKTLGLIGGLGTIGQRVAAMARALGMQVVVSDLPTTALGVRHELGSLEVVSFDSLLARSDFVSVHCPLNENTKGLIDSTAIAKMKPTAYIVNTARGSIIDQTALVEALKARRIAGAALDVFGPGSAPPPALPDNSPLYGLDNLILTPHIGWQRVESRQRVVDMCAHNIAAFARGEPTNIDLDTGLPRINKEGKPMTRQHGP